MEFTQEDLNDAIEAAVRDQLARAGVPGPNVDLLELAQSYFRIPVEYVEPEDEEPRRYGDAPKRRANPGAIVLKFDQSPESQQTLAGRAVVRQLLPGLYQKLGIVPGTENKSSEKQLVGIILPRLLLPTQWFGPAARRSGFDLVALKKLFPAAGYETIAWRLLDADDEASVVAIVDDGSVTARRGNRFPANKVLTPAEDACWRRVAETKDPARVRRDDWTAQGWPVSGIPFRRIVLRAVPDGI